MTQNLKKALWERYKKYLISDTASGFSLDVSRVDFSDSFFDDIAPKVEAAFNFMEELEAGAIANPDEKRMVGHYWLRGPSLSPNKSIREAIETSQKNITLFADQVRTGGVKGSKGERFSYLLVIGIGGSALGPQFVSHALGTRNGFLEPFFIDNTDPEGIERVLLQIPDLSKTLVVVISKSGSTPEPRNAMLVTKALFEKTQLQFNEHAVAITGEDSALDRTALSEKWLARFPMWDWVGGRTSELSAVGLVPAALQGIDFGLLLAGAKYMDALTRTKDQMKNPAMVLAQAWYFLGEGCGSKAMVVLPYRDRLELFSRYLQQLVMESLGKEKDLEGRVVNQGLSVYGNKGSTDQHAYVQQLREGLNNFFVTFIKVGRDILVTEPLEVEPGITSSDYLNGFLLGTRAALYENGRQSITISLSKVDPHDLGMLIALFERAVGFYAILIGVNAYHQPGVEAGKRAAAEVLETQQRMVNLLQEFGGSYSAEQMAGKLNLDTETVWHLANHLVNTGRFKIDLPAGVASTFSFKGGQ